MMLGAPAETIQDQPHLEEAPVEMIQYRGKEINKIINQTINEILIMRREMQQIGEEKLTRTGKESQVIGGSFKSINKGSKLVKKCKIRKIWREFREKKAKKLIKKWKIFPKMKLELKSL